MNDALRPLADQSLEAFCRALAMHVMLTTYPRAYHGPLAPEYAEGIATAILRFARGEAMVRPQTPPD